MSGYPATPCQYAAPDGYGVAFACPHNPGTHPDVTVAITEDQFRTRTYPDQGGPCPVCGTPTGAHLAGSAFRMDGRLYLSSHLPTGTIYRYPCWRGTDGTQPCHDWDNCPGEHLHVVCPNGRHWDIDGRASNCTLPQDRTHRCWVRHGDPPQITVDKSGQTCSAGAGSIQIGDYHGFLQDGNLTAG